MFNYIKGVITIIDGNMVVVENNGIGYSIIVANPYSYEIGKDVTIYTYNKVAEDENSLYGFKSLEERNLFLKLLGVKGLGPKVGIGFFATGSVGGIIDAIQRENVLYLKKFPKVGEKLAKQIVLDLKGKVSSEEANKDSGNDAFELISALEALGYKASVHNISPAIQFTFVQNTDNHVQISLGGWTADYPSASTFLMTLFSCESFLQRSSAQALL